MRLEEILTLTWDRVDLERGLLYLPGHRRMTGTHYAVTPTPA
jgi:hypothetical protein